MSPRSERPESAFLKEALAGSRFSQAAWVAETGSTNDDLSVLARSGAPEQVLITDLQTAGRGRRDRVWDAPSRSSILMSLLIRGIQPADGFWVVGAVALAASQAIDELIDVPCRLKWPNDVLIGPAGAQMKAAGVLAQLVDDAAIVGIGINVNWPKDLPTEMQGRATAVNHHVPGASRFAEVDRVELATDIIRRAIGHLEADRETLRNDWKAQCSTLGQRVRLELEGAPIQGNARDIAPDGALILENEGVSTTHQVGDVVHLRPITNPLS